MLSLGSSNHSTVTRLPGYQTITLARYLLHKYWHLSGRCPCLKITRALKRCMLTIRTLCWRQTGCTLTHPTGGGLTFFKTSYFVYLNVYYKNT